MTKTTTSPSKWWSSLPNGDLLSDDQQYRYLLWRTWGPEPIVSSVLWLMLNPIWADDTTDDPTLKECIRFSKLWRFERLFVCNMYALRTLHPQDLFRHADPIGPRNRAVLREMAQQVEMVICAWGNHAPRGRVAAVLRELQESNLQLRFFHLGLTKSGAPKHPLARGSHRIPHEQHPLPLDLQPLLGATRS